MDSADPLKLGERYIKKYQQRCFPVYSPPLVVIRS